MFTVAQQIALLLTRRVIVCVCVCALVRLCVGERDTERLRDRERGKEDGQAVSSLSWWQTEETDVSMAVPGPILSALCAASRR